MEHDFDWAEWIKFERLLRGWSQNKMAKKAIVPSWQSTLNRIETKTIGVTFRNLVIVAKIFGLPPSDVIKIADAPYAESTNTGSVNNYSEIGKIVKTRRESLELTEVEVGMRINSTTLRVIDLERRFQTKIKVNTVISLDSILNFNGELIKLVWELVEQDLIQ
jgi:transcriptional regulator with XRE-family HTH domain